MEKSKVFGIGAVIGLVLLGGLGTFAFYYQGSGFRGELDAKQAALDQAQARIRQLEADLKKAQQELAALKTESDEGGEGLAVKSAADSDNAVVPSASTPQNEAAQKFKKLQKLMQDKAAESTARDEWR